MAILRTQNKHLCKLIIFLHFFLSFKPLYESTVCNCNLLIREYTVFFVKQHDVVVLFLDDFHLCKKIVNILIKHKFYSCLNFVQSRKHTEMIQNRTATRFAVLMLMESRPFWSIFGPFWSKNNPGLYKSTDSL